MLSITNYEGTLTEALVCRGKPVVKKNIDGLYELTLDASQYDNPYSFNFRGKYYRGGWLSVQNKAITTEI